MKSFGRSSSLVSSIVDDPVDLVLEHLPERVTGRGLQLIAVGLVDHLVHVLLGLADGVEDVVVGQRIGDGVLYTDTVALDEQPVVDHGLDVAVKQAVFVVADLKL